MSHLVPCKQHQEHPRPFLRPQRRADPGQSAKTGLETKSWSLGRVMENIWSPQHLTCPHIRVVDLTWHL